MSGGSGSGGIGRLPSLPVVDCEDLFLRSGLSSPNRSVVSEISVGDTLEVAIMKTGDVEFVAVMKDEAIAGAIIGNLQGRLMQCLRSGHQYEAEVVDMPGAIPTVCIRHV